jgi:IS605 OrfB family transposase
MIKREKLVKTLKLEIRPDSSRHNDILSTVTSYNQVFSVFANWLIQHRSFSKRDSNRERYMLLRKRFMKLPSAFLQIARDDAVGNVRATTKKRGWNVSVNRKKQSLRYDQRTSTLRGQQLTLSCEGKRLKIIVPRCPTYFREVYETWDFKGGVLTYNAKKKKFHFCFTFTKEVPEKVEQRNVVGVDCGIRVTAALSNGKLFGSQKNREVRRKRLYQRRALQAKGTRSAKKRFMALSKKEKRFGRQENQIIVNKLLKTEFDTFVLEDLTDIKSKKLKGKHFKKRHSDWSFAHLQFCLTYKCKELGKRAVLVDPSYTSQTCNLCGHVSPDNRRGLLFRCTRCGHTDHADVNAARNLRDRYLLSLEGEAGCLVNHPYVPGLPLLSGAR